MIKNYAGILLMFCSIITMGQSSSKVTIEDDPTSLVLKSKSVSDGKHAGLGKTTKRSLSLPYEEDFESYTADSYFALQYGNDSVWTTWSNSPGGSNDAYVSEQQAISGQKSLLIDGNADLVFLPGGGDGALTGGRYKISLNVYVPQGNTGYYNLLQNFDGSNSAWGYQIQFENGSAAIEGGDGTTVSYTSDQWLNIISYVDIDEDWCEIYFDDVLVHSFQWSVGTNNTNINAWDAINFYAWTTDGGVATAYFDDLMVEEVLASEAPSNLTAVVENVNDVNLTWSAPVNMTPLNYVITRNGVEIATITETNYTDGYLYPTTYEYGVRAVYSEIGTSAAINTLVTIEGGVPRNCVLFEQLNSLGEPMMNPSNRGLVEASDTLGNLAIISYYINDAIYGGAAQNQRVFDYYGDLFYGAIWADGVYSHSSDGTITGSFKYDYIDLYEKMASVPAIVSMEMEVVNNNDGTFTANADLTEEFEYYDDGLVLRFALTESNISEASGFNGQLHFVNRYIDTTGIALDFTDSIVSITEDFTIEGNIEDYELIAFVQHNPTKSVLQAVKSTLMDSSAQTVQVTFNVDMNNAEGFDFTTEEVFVTGSFCDWADPGSEESVMLEDIDGDLVYTGAVVVDVFTEISYKYFQNYTWVEGEPIENDRTLQVWDTDVEVYDVWGQSNEIDELIIPFTSAPVIDGVIDASDPWGNGWVYQELTKPSSTTFNMFSKFQMVHNGETIFLVAEVEDPTPSNDPELIFNTYERDCIETFFSFKSSDHESGDYTDGDHQIRCQRDHPYGEYIDGSSYVSDLLQSGNVEYAVSSNSDGYIIEMAYNIEALAGESDFDGTNFRFDIATTDNTTGQAGGRTQQRFWNSDSDQQWQNTTYFGNAILENEFTPTEVIATFNCDVAYASNFDPIYDDVYLTGSFNGWIEPGEEGSVLMSDDNGDGIYSASTVVFKDETIAYKYFINTGWVDGDPYGDRSFYSAQDTNIINDQWGFPPTEIVVNVDMKNARGFNAETDSVFISGSFCEWAVPGSDESFRLFDENNDGIYSNTILIDNATEIINYRYFVNGGWSKPDPFEDGNTMDGSRLILNIHDYDSINDEWGYEALQNVSVQFNVDMNAVNGFNATTDQLYVSGNFSNWNEPGNNESVILYDFDGDGIFTAEIEVIENYGLLEYRYFINESFEGAEWIGGNNRTLSINGWGHIVNPPDVFGVSSTVVANTSSSVNLYPNPFVNEIYFRSSVIGSVVKIYNLHGKLLKQYKSKGLTMQINTNSYKSGLYTLLIIEPSGKKLIKQMIKY